MKRIVITILFIFLISSTKIYTQTLNQQIEEVLTDSLFEVSQIAIDIYNLSTDEYLFRKNENLVLRPASNMKILTSAAALLYLGDSAKFTTYISTNGEIRDSVLFGDIGVHGGFDPLLSTSDLDSIIHKIKSKGIKSITGTIWTDVSNIDSLYFGNGWMWDDNPYKFMPYLSSLNLNGNSVKIFYSPGDLRQSALVRTEPHSNYFNIRNESVTTKEDTSNIKIYRDWLNNSNTIIISGDISYNENLDSAEFNLIDPQSYFNAIFGERLNAAGIITQNENRGRVERVAYDTIAVFERSLIDVLSETMKESDNLSAEMLIRKLSAEYFSGPASSEKGNRLIDSLIVSLGFSPKTFVIADGSGLSHYNLVSASLIVELLKYFYQHRPNLYGFLYNSFPIAGVEGTLKNRMKYGYAFKNVHAKTGTISGVSNLSGYLNSNSGSIIAFSILIQNYSGTSKRARSIQDRICNILAEQ